MEIENIKQGLRKSKFRSSFTLSQEDRLYIERVGLTKLASHTEDFIVKNLASKNPRNDGKQTPFKGHPVFKAQHATATCCRKCLSRWYRIPQNKALNESQVLFVKEKIMGWIFEELERYKREV